MKTERKQATSGPKTVSKARHAKISPVMIADELRSAIVDGAFRSGVRITERVVAERFGCTAAMTRESFHLLEKHGAIILSARRGARVIDAEFAPPDELFIVWDRLRALLGEELRRRNATVNFVPSSERSPRHRLAAVERVLTELGETSRNPRLTQAMARIALHVAIVSPDRLFEIEESLRQ